FGEIKSEGDFNRLRKLEVGDVIKKITFEGDVDLILSLNKDMVDDWNVILDSEYPDLKKYPIKEATATQKAAYMQELENIYQKDDFKEEKDSEYYPTRLIRGVFNKLGNYTPRKPVLSN
ncbi:peptidylprolyl isomerase, partial [Candidatus Gracilibacteria bacterium]